MNVIVVLTGIVEEAGVLRIALLDDLFQALALEAGAFQELVAVGHVGLMVLVVVILQRLLGHVGLESLVVVRKGRQFESHGKLLFFGVNATPAKRRGSGEMSAVWRDHKPACRRGQPR